MVNFALPILHFVKKIISFIRHSHPEIYKAILFVIAIGLIVYVFPKQGKFKYEYRNLKGKPWHHDDLIAPFDFSIRKSKEEIANEKYDIIKNHHPYFRYDVFVQKNKKDIFSKEFKQLKSTNNKEKNLSSALALLDSIYSKGIIEPSAIIDGKPNDYTVFLLKNNVAEEKELGDFFTIKSAYEYIQSKLSSSAIQANSDLIQLIENAIAHNVFYDKATSDKILNQSVEDILPSHDIIVKDQKIISKGDILDVEKFQIIESLQMEYDSQEHGTASFAFILFGQLILVTITMAILTVFLFVFRKEIFSDNAKITFILLLMVLQVVMAKFAVSSQTFSIYLLPFCILPVIIRAFYDTRVALFVHLVTILIISFMVPNRFEFAFIQLLGGMIAIFSIVNMRNRSQIFVSALLIFVTYSVSYFGITIIQEGGSDVLTWYDFAWFGVSALLTIFSYPLIFVFEKLFGFISDVSLLELSDTNRKLLRELASRAPGTFQHSLQVANLAEDAIYAIGGNSLLVRAGALYHDIGKMEMPMYFIENQAGGVDPHGEMSFDESASIIISHVIKGIEIAKKHNLPEQIIDFIRTHHGTTITAYFYRSFQNAFPEEEVDESKFHYPGPIPFSKETAVLMMADSVEAASRSLQKYDAETIDALVEKIINSQIEQEQFANADVTFKDITKLKKMFKKKLMNIYHVRVEYPR